MKKLLIVIAFVILLVGCGNNNKDAIIKKWSKKVDGMDSYLMKGTLEIYRNEDLYTYDLESAYLKKDKFRVGLTNKTNNHEQIILKNDKGVYVVTPSLNKSFKFQSEWPYNNSQIYLLQPLLIDLKNDDKVTLEEKDGKYILTAKVNYINDKNLTKEKIYLDKNLKLKKVEVLDDNDDVIMRLKVTKIETNNNFDDRYFDIDETYNTSTKNKDKSKDDKKNGDSKLTEDSKDNDIKTDDNGNQNNNINKEENNTDNTNNNINNKTTTTSKVDDVLYPMYVPVDTYLDTQDVVSLDNGTRTILTFSGDSPFTFVQSPVDSTVVDYLNGDPYLVADSVGAVSDTSVAWISNDKEYYLSSTSVSADELLLIADSLSVAEVGK